MKSFDIQSKRYMRLLFVCGVLLVLKPLYAADDSKPLESAEPLTAVNLDMESDWDYRLDKTGRLWLAYYDQNRLLRLRDPEGREQPLGPQDRSQAPSGLALSVLGTGAGVLWRDKYPDKGLYFLDTNQPEQTPQELGGDTEPLARLKTAAGAGDLLHILWLGEKSHESTGDLYHLYYRNWDRRTQALSPTARLMPGIYPVMSTDAAGGVMVYSWLMDETPKRIVARYRPVNAATDAADGGFNDPVTVAEAPTITPIFKAFQSGSRWFVIWLAQYGVDGQEFLLEGAHSDDQGTNWKRFAFEDLRGFDVGSLQVAADQDGHLLMALTARKRTSSDIKQNVYVIRSDDRGDTWSALLPIRHWIDPNENQSNQASPSLNEFHARNPSVIFGDQPGQAVIIWEDWRNIYSGLYASLSNDYGRTWTFSNVALPHEPGKNLALNPEINAIYNAGNGFQVIAEQTDNRFQEKQLVRLSFTADDLAGHAKSEQASKYLDVKTQETALRKRAEDYWQTMVAADYAQTYTYQDPFFRASASLQTYLSSMGKVQYTHAQVDSIRINGPKAEVMVSIRASVPPFKSPTTGESVSQPERAVTIPNNWLWLDGEWYTEFRNKLEEKVFTRY